MWKVQEGKALPVGDGELRPEMIKSFLLIVALLFLTTLPAATADIARASLATDTAPASEAADRVQPSPGLAAPAQLRDSLQPNYSPTSAAGDNSRCCITCSGVRVCACGVKMSCGECCVGLCCKP